MLPEGDLSRREREVMEIIHRRGRATAAEVRADMSDPPTVAAVRSTLREIEARLEERRRETEARTRELEEALAASDVSDRIREVEARMEALDTQRRIERVRERLEPAEARLLEILNRMR